MTVRVSTDWTFRDIGTIVLENELLRVVIMPGLGAKIWQLTYKPRDKDLLWHNPRLQPRMVPFHSVYDDTFFGGWDEMYPNDLPEVLNGETEPDHGEVWALPWEYALEISSGDEATVHLWVETPISASRVEKWITLRSGEATLHFHHQIVNTGQTAQPFLWKLHPALAVHEGCRIELGARTMHIEGFGPSRGGETGISYRWPYLIDSKGARQDMRSVPPRTARVNDLQYATEMCAGWCAITDTWDQVGFALTFDLDVLPSCVLFGTYGGWRDLYTVILEPCTGFPISVNDGIGQGTHRVLPASEMLEWDVTAVLFEGTSAAEVLGYSATE